MHYQTYSPPEKLKDFIRFFWVYEADASPVNPLIHLSTASSSAKLSFLYQGRFSKTIRDGEIQNLFKTGFETHTSGYQEIIATENVGVFGIYFEPYALPYLLAIPAEALSNQNIEISDTLGKAGKELEEKILSASSNQERMAIASEFFKKRLSLETYEKPGIIASIKYIIQRKGFVNLEELISRNFLSQRQFERNFKSLAGFSPKMFSRIIRFEHSIDLLLSNPESFTVAALESGYYDQSHFIKDFREFSGQNPKAYCNHDLSVFARG